MTSTESIESHISVDIYHNSTQLRHWSFTEITLGEARVAASRRVLRLMSACTIQSIPDNYVIGDSQNPTAISLDHSSTPFTASILTV